MSPFNSHLPSFIAVYIWLAIFSKLCTCLSSNYQSSVISPPVLTNLGLKIMNTYIYISPDTLRICYTKYFCEVSRNFLGLAGYIFEPAVFGSLHLKVPGLIASDFSQTFGDFGIRRKLIVFSLPLVNFTAEKCTAWKILMKM